MAMTELTNICTRLQQDLTWLTVAKYFEKLDSTQNRILQFLPKTGDGAVLIIAESQTKGVGRLGRTWVSPPGGLWFSLALPLKNISLEQTASFSMVVALQVAEALKEVNNLVSELKWPNDILSDGKKVAGIILSTTTKFKKSWLVIGVGINVNNEITGDLSKTATSIAQVRKQSQGRTRLLEAILMNLYEAWSEFDRTGFGPYQKAVEARLTGIGEKIQIKVGTKTMNGTMKAVDPQGNLLLESTTGIKTINSGEIVNLTV